MNNLKISKGKLGSIVGNPEMNINIKPLTVFIGKQGTGKSLVSQLSYFFYNLPYLITYQSASDRKQGSPQDLIRTVIDNLRSDRRAIGVFADPSAKVEWDNFSITLDQRNRQIHANKALISYVEQILSGKITFKSAGKALFVPAERIIFPHARPSVWKLFSWPSTLVLYGDAIQNASNIYSQWTNNLPNSEAGKRIHELSLQALGGEVIKYGEDWRWQIDRNTRIDLDMASSGQKANWSWLLLAETLLDERDQGLLDEPFRIYIEEPEIHLHPSAQRSMMQILTYLANQGIEVLLTTHSLTMLYELNNLVTAATLLPNALADDRVPPADFRISPEKVAAYLFQENGNIESLVQQQNLSIDGNNQRIVPWINEDKLRLVDEELEQELSRIRSYGMLWDKKE